MKKIPRINSLVRFNMKQIPYGHEKEYPFKKKDVFLFLGEIVQAPEHCCVINIDTGKFYGFYHTSDFIELKEEEV